MLPTDNNQEPLRIIGTPVMENGCFVLKEFAIIDKVCGWICPCCGNEVSICPTRSGEQTFSCSICNTPFRVNVNGDASTFLPSKKSNPARGLLITPVEEPVGPQQPVAPGPMAPASPGPVAPGPMAPGPMAPGPDGPSGGGATVIGNRPSKGYLQWGGIFSRKKHILREGHNTIGRKDSQKHSDVEFDDPEMSRQSVCIDALPGNEFMFNVNKSLNPVKVNGKVIYQGFCIKLRNGDEITMGKTNITFKID
ncbi:MAG: FHA domain-containing protein [Prevotella sp.]|nr:FHA domain-containing protein [Prevotella sp.]